MTAVMKGLVMKGAVANGVIMRGGPMADSGVTPPRQFTAWAYRQRFEGADGATTFAADEIAGIALSGGTGVSLSTTNPLEGVSSMVLTGVGQGNSADNDVWRIPAGKFTRAVKFRIDSLATLQVIISQYRLAANKAWRLYVDTNGQLTFQYSVGGTTDSVNLSTQAGQIQAGVNYEVMVDRDATGVLRIYVDGVMMNSTPTSGAASFDSTTTFLIGADRDSGGTTTNRFAGKIDDVRMSNTEAFCGSDFGYNITSGYVNSPSINYESPLLPAGFTKISNVTMAVIGPSTGARNGGGQGDSGQEQWTGHLSTGYLEWAKRMYNAFYIPIWHDNSDPFFQGLNFARSSYIISDMALTVPAALASDANVIYVVTGRNDINGVKTAAQIITESKNLLLSLVGQGKLIIWEELYERDTAAGGIWAAGGQGRADLQAINAEMLTWCPANGIVVMRVRKAQINTSALVPNSWKGHVTDDFIHVSALGAKRIGGAMAYTFRQLFNPKAAYNAADVANIAPNASLTGTGGAISGTALGVAPTSYTLSSSGVGIVTGSQPGDGSYQMSFATVGAGGSGVEAKLTLTADLTGLTLNGWYALRMRIKSSAAPTCYAIVPHLADRNATPKHAQDCVQGTNTNGADFNTTVSASSYPFPPEADSDFLEYETPPLKLTATTGTIELLIRANAGANPVVLRVKDVDLRPVTDPTT